MSVVDRLLDQTDPIADGEESWSERDWGTIYCMGCGEESTRLERGRLVSIYTCGNEGCDVGTKPVLRHPIKWLVVITTVVTLAVSAVGVSSPLDVVAGLVSGIAFHQGGWYLFYDPAGFLEEVSP